MAIETAESRHEREIERLQNDPTRGQMIHKLGSRGTYNLGSFGSWSFIHNKDLHHIGLCFLISEERMVQIAGYLTSLFDGIEVRMYERPEMKHDDYKVYSIVADKVKYNISQQNKDTLRIAWNALEACAKTF